VVTLVLTPELSASLMTRTNSLLSIAFSIDGQAGQRRVHSSSCAQCVMASKPEQVAAGVLTCAHGHAAPPSAIFTAIQPPSPVKFTAVGKPSFDSSHHQLLCAICIHFPP
jgi:hypothetical protein